MYKDLFRLESEIISALSSSRRLEIVRLLREGPLCVRDIEEMLDLPQANISQHLTVLRQVGIVKTERKGKNVIYSLTHENFVKVSDLIREVLVEKHRDDDLGDEFMMKMTDLVPVKHDPVCNMRVSPKTASFACKHEGEDYYFCASGCLKKFKNNPEKFIRKE